MSNNFKVGDWVCRNPKYFDHSHWKRLKDTPVEVVWSDGWDIQVEGFIGKWFGRKFDLALLSEAKLKDWL